MSKIIKKAFILFLTIRNKKKWFSQDLRTSNKGRIIMYNTRIEIIGVEFVLNLGYLSLLSLISVLLLLKLKELNNINC